MFARSEARGPRAGTRAWSAIVLGLLQCLGVLGCQSTGPAASSTVAVAFALGGTSWRAVEIEGRPTDARVESTLAFEGDQRVSGSTGCNRYTGPVSVTDTSFRVGVIAMTRMACPPPESDQETRFIGALETARGYRQEGDILQLLDAQGRSLLRFTRR